MPEIFVAKIADLPEGGRKIVQHGSHDIGVFHWEGQFYAYSNLCLHQGGPACEGLIMHQVEDVIGPDKTWVGQRFSTSRSISSAPGTATNTTSEPANAPPTEDCASKSTTSSAAAMTFSSRS